LSPADKIRLLTSMDAGRLVVLCGAGLSMAPPSNLPSARRVAEICFDTYHARVDSTLNPALRESLDDLAEYFAGLSALPQFIANFVPWSELQGQPNPGHAAIADFLITKTVVAGLSSNYDNLIELCAWHYGADFRGLLDGDEATACSHTQAPLLKFHGCSNRDRGSTVWALSQLVEATIADRIGKTKVWMAANLRQKDLLIVGFWSDWSYLNQVIGAAIQGLSPMSVTVIDPSDAVDLERKAPEFWALAHQEQVAFTHIQESGSDALDELRLAFSINYLRQVLIAGRPVFEEAMGTDCDPEWLTVTELDSESLYDWRRDAEGVPAGSPATENRPRNGEALGYFHLLLRYAGALQQNQGYSFEGRNIRVINGAECILSSLAKRFVEAPAISSADLFVAVGATDLGLPGDVIRSGRPGSVIRPAAIGEWLTLDQARTELGI